MKNSNKDDRKLLWTFPKILSVRKEILTISGVSGYDCDALFTTSASTDPQELEIKGVNYSYFDSRFNPSKNDNWNFQNLPISSITVNTLDSLDSKDYTYTLRVPEGSYWMLNVTGKNAPYAWQNKWFKMLNENQSLCYLFTDGLLFFTPYELREAFSGYAWYKCRVRTTYNRPEDRYKQNGYGYELKAMINLEKGTFYPMEVPEDFSNNKKFTY